MATSKTQRGVRHRRNAGELPRDAILRLLKVRREMTTLELQRALKITETAVRRHLQRLQREGLIASVSQPRAKGRPVNLYRLTDKATTAYFPNGYEELAARVLGTVFDAEGHRGVFNFLMGANQHAAMQMLAQVVDRPLEQRVQAIATHFRDNGYMTDYRRLPDGRFFLYHQNCAIHNLAAQYRQLCLVEMRLIETLAGIKVTRQQYMFKGQPICGYLIAK